MFYEAYEAGVFPAPFVKRLWLATPHPPFRRTKRHLFPQGEKVGVVRCIGNPTQPGFAGLSRQHPLHQQWRFVQVARGGALGGDVAPDRPHLLGAEAGAGGDFLGGEAVF